jgi:NADPH-dependent 2,4-dienoyl-CoA reductase/sulfur reductase-like enzyme
MRNERRSEVMSSGVVIVGASVAGLTVARELRSGGYRKPVTLIGAEQHLPYDRPPLSKQVLAGTWDADATLLSTDAVLSELDVDVALGSPALALDVSTRTVMTTDRAFSAEHVVVATGATPRMLAGAEGLQGVHVLRTIEDSLTLRADLQRGARVLIVGDGVLGTEIAATAASLGNHVTIVGPQTVPMARQLGEAAAAALAQLHTERGVTLLPGVSVVAFGAVNGAVTDVTVESGRTLPVEVVVIAIGARPATDWLSSSGLSLDDGVICDATCLAAENIYAVGDVARFHHRSLDRWLRLENRTNATEQGLLVAGNIMGNQAAYTPTPYFWTDQYDARIQVYGTPTAGAHFTVVDGDVSARRFVGEWRTGGHITGILGWNMPKQTRIRRQQMASEVETFQ